MEARRQEADSEPNSGVYTYVQYIAKGMRNLGERQLSQRDLEEAWKHAPVGTCIIEFFERAESVVGGEILRGEERNRSIGYTRDAKRLLDDELDALEAEEELYDQ
jgi:hypothetical protein